MPYGPATASSSPMTEVRIRSTSASGPGPSSPGRSWVAAVPPVSISEQHRGWADRPRGASARPSGSGDEHLAQVAEPVAVEVHPAADPADGAARRVLPEGPAVAVPVAAGDGRCGAGR